MRPLFKSSDFCHKVCGCQHHPQVHIVTKKMLFFDWDLPLDSSTLYYMEEHKSHLFTFSIPLNFINLCHITLSFLCQLKYLSPLSHSWQSLLVFSVEATRHRPQLSRSSGDTIPVNFSSLNFHSFVLLGAHGQL